MIMMTPEGGATKILTSGEYRDLIEIQGDKAVFRSRRAVYDADVLPRYIVFPF
jgi:anthranilate 1,2-dioxygenase small subunit